MFSGLNDPTLNAIMSARLARLRPAISALDLSTREDLLAQVFSIINSAVNLGVGPTPIKPIQAAQPALANDLFSRFQSMNQDAQDFITQLEDVEAKIASFYNLAGTVENRLRQVVRSAAYLSSPTQWQEEFIDTTQEASATCTVDTTAGVLTLPLTSTTAVPWSTIALGTSTSGVLVGALSSLSDGTGLSVVSVQGTAPVLELVLTFTQPVVVNRLNASLDNFAGYQVSTWVTSSDGVTEQDVLGDLLPGENMWAADSCKLSGDVVLRFRPRSIVRMRLVLQDHALTGNIALTGLALYQDQYSSAGTWISNPINLSGATAAFEAVQWTSSATNSLVSASHQLSSDGVNYVAIVPGQVVQITSPMYYKASLSRNDALFTSQATTAFGSDPGSTSGYTLISSYTTPLDGQVYQRSLVYSAASGPLTLAEAVISGSLTITVNGSVLATSLYSFNGTVVDLFTAYTNVTISYQTSYPASSNLSQLDSSYTPIVSSVSFRKVS